MNYRQKLQHSIPVGVHDDDVTGVEGDVHLLGTRPPAFRRRTKGPALDPAHLESAGTRSTGCQGSALPVKMADAVY